MQEFGGLRGVGDIYEIYGQAFGLLVFIGNIEMAAAIPRKE